MSSTYHVTRAPAMQGEITVPGDKSISHRAAMFAALSNGSCQITGFLSSEDCLNTLEIMRALGASVEVTEQTPHGPTGLRVTGCSADLTAPTAPLDCGNSGTTMRLMSGILAAQAFPSVLFGDPSLSRRPMQRVIDPLAQMGARILGQGEKGLPPLSILGGERLQGIRYQLPVASAQVKSAILLAGMLTEGATTVIEPQRTRDHTERMMAAFQVALTRDGTALSIHGPQTPVARDIYVPGDISSAAFWIVAAAVMPGAKLTVQGVGLNPTRTGILAVLRRMGANIVDTVESEDGEPFGSVQVIGGPLRGTVIEGDEISNVIDELPILSVAAALAEGKTIIRDAKELRVKETDRIAVVAAHLKAMGALVEEREDGMEITGGQALRGATVASHGDHRIAMAFAIAGLFAEGTTIIEDTACVATSYPGFDEILIKVQAGTLERMVSGK